MSVYNGASFLREAVESILRQSFGDFEFIVVDDGSTDDSRQILEGFAQSDGRVRIISRPNRGLTVSLNEALSAARGRFVARMDADDTAMHERFERQMAYLESHPECAAIGSWMLLVDPDGDPVGYSKPPEDHEAIDRYNLIWGGGGIPHPSAMMRLDAVRRVGCYREELPVSQDGDLFLRLAEIGRLANLPAILLRYRLHASSVSVRKRKEQVHYGRLSVLDACRRRNIRPMEDGVLHEKCARPPVDPRQGWAQSALEARMFRAARKHAWASLRKTWWAKETWGVLAAALFPRESQTQKRRGWKLVRTSGRTLGRWSVLACGLLLSQLAARGAPRDPQ
jgi:glycosyltransferase involved in cell wall biosynthesis